MNRPKSAFLSHGGRAARARDVLIVCAFCAGLLYFLAKAASGDWMQSDFNLIWVAGRVWLAGGNPYGPDFADAATRLLPVGAAQVAWVYPPNWWALAIVVGSLPATVAFAAWNATGVALTFITVAFWFGALKLVNKSLSWRTPALMFAFLFFMTASGGAFKVGQTGFVVGFGFAVLAYGLAARHSVIGAIGLALLLLKPQIGLVVLATLCIDRRAWGIALLGCVATAALAVPAIVEAGLAPTLKGLMVNIGHYRDIPYNLPTAMTGVGNLIAWATGYLPSAMGLTLVAGAVAALLFRYGSRGTLSNADAWSRFRLFFLVNLSCVIGIVSLHIYDLVALAGLVLFVTSLRMSTAVFSIAGFVLVLRPENWASLARPTADSNATAATIAAIGGLFLLIAMFIEVFDQAQAPTRSRRIEAS